MPSLNYLSVGAYLAALVITLVLAAWLTPPRWWRRPNARALAIVAGGTWGLGTLLLSLGQAPAIAALAQARPLQAQMLQASAPAASWHLTQTYRVREDLNLRSSTGIGAPRIAVVPAGAVVTTTGLRDGDWWQLSTRIGGRDVRGWSSSLWLRRVEETRP